MSDSHAFYRELNAIERFDVFPGSNPLFGLNTLGGALSVQTKDGRRNPGASVQVQAGSHQRRAAEFEEVGEAFAQALHRPGRGLGLRQSGLGGGGAHLASAASLRSISARPLAFSSAVALSSAASLARSRNSSSWRMGISWSLLLSRKPP